METYAVDFETFYSDECSVRTLGNRGYFSHPDFDAYMVSVVGSDGYEYCGHPKLFDWTMLAGNRVLSHNAAFDETLYLFGTEKGWYPKVDFAEWHCTADLCAYFNIPRSLKGAVKWIWKEEMPKTTRDNMKNRRWELMSPEFKAEVTEYALKDSRYCLRVWEELSESWPEQERWVSQHTRTMMRRGLPMDTDLLVQNLRNAKTVLFEAEAMIPWAGEEKLLSPKAFAKECRKYGIDPPASLAIDSEEADSWIETYGEKLPWATAVRSWRSVNSLVKKLQNFDNGTLGGRYYGGMMYCGAHTKRFSGSGGNGNMQNLPRKVMHGANIRNMIKASPGHKLVVVDLSQIEVRTVLWLAQDHKAMEMLRRIPDIYTAFAVMFGQWSEAQGDLKKVNPALRDRFKTVGLGVQFGASAGKVASITGQPESEAEAFIRAYHKALPSVPRLWKSLKASLAAARKDGVLEFLLPSGNRLIYRDVKACGARSTTATIVKNGSPMTVRLWHGSLIENLAQSLARDIFVDAVRRIETAGYKLILHVHDEVVIEVPEEASQKCLDDCLEIMSTPPSWISDIPLSAEGKILDRYEK
jgi:DNA polymerase